MQPRLETLWEAEWEAAGDVVHDEDTEDTEGSEGDPDAEAFADADADNGSSFSRSRFASQRQREWCRRRGSGDAPGGPEAPARGTSAWEAVLLLGLAGLLVAVGSVSAAGAVLALVVAAATTVVVECRRRRPVTA